MYIYIYIYIFILYIYIYNNLVVELHTSCAQALELPQSHFGNNKRAHYSHDCICVMSILLLQNLSTFCVLDIYIYIYIYNICQIICVTSLISKRRSSLNQSLIKTKHKAHPFSTTNHLERLGYVWYLQILLMV